MLAPGNRRSPSACWQYGGARHRLSGHPTLWQSPSHRGLKGENTKNRLSEYLAIKPNENERLDKCITSKKRDGAGTPGAGGGRKKNARSVMPQALRGGLSAIVAAGIQRSETHPFAITLPARQVPRTSTDTVAQVGRGAARSKVAQWASMLTLPIANARRGGRRSQPRGFKLGTVREDYQCPVGGMVPVPLLISTRVAPHCAVDQCAVRFNQRRWRVGGRAVDKGGCRCIDQHAADAERRSRSRCRWLPANGVPALYRCGRRGAGATLDVPRCWRGQRRWQACLSLPPGRHCRRSATSAVPDVAAGRRCCSGNREGRC